MSFCIVSGKFTLTDINLTIGVMNVKLNLPSNFPAIQYSHFYQEDTSSYVFNMCSEWWYQKKGRENQLRLQDY